jgi:hypothetical protein
VQPPEGLAERGAALWAALVADRSFSPSAGLLLAEACRIADRLERLDLLLRGEESVWARLVHDLRTDSYELVIDGALSEARQQASTLRQIVATLEEMTKKESDEISDALRGLVAGLSSPLRD